MGKNSGVGSAISEWSFVKEFQTLEHWNILRQWRDCLCCAGPAVCCVFLVLSCSCFLTRKSHQKKMLSIRAMSRYVPCSIDPQCWAGGNRGDKRDRGDRGWWWGRGDGMESGWLTTERSSDWVSWVFSVSPARWEVQRQEWGWADLLTAGEVTSCPPLTASLVTTSPAQQFIPFTAGVTKLFVVVVSDEAQHAVVGRQSCHEGQEAQQLSSGSHYTK